jgi:hypothetical protein
METCFIRSALLGLQFVELIILKMQGVKRRASSDPSSQTIKRHCLHAHSSATQPIEQPCDDQAKSFDAEQRRKDRDFFSPAPKGKPDVRLRIGAAARGNKSSPSTPPVRNLPEKFNYSKLGKSLFLLLNHACSYPLKGKISKQIQDLRIEDICNSLDYELCRRSRNIVNVFLDQRTLNLDKSRRNDYGQKQIKELMVSNPDLQTVARDFIDKLMQRDPEFKKEFFEVTEWRNKEADECMKRNLWHYLGVLLVLDKSGTSLDNLHFNASHDQEGKSTDRKCFDAKDTMDDST